MCLVMLGNNDWSMGICYLLRCITTSIDHSISLCLPSDIVISFGLYAMLLGNPSYIFLLVSRSFRSFNERSLLLCLVKKRRERMRMNILARYWSCNTLPIKYIISNFFKRSAYIEWSIVSIQPWIWIDN